MEIKLFYDDEYIEGRNDYSCVKVTFDSWEKFWDRWNDASDFFRCDDMYYGGRCYIKKDRVIQIIGDEE